MGANSGEGFFKRKKSFTQVSNLLIRDKNLSLKSKGLYALINSYLTLEDFILYKSFLQKNMIEGRDSFNGAWNELKDAGYLIQNIRRTPEGKFIYEYELLDEPMEREEAETTKIDKIKEPKNTKDTKKLDNYKQNESTLNNNTNYDHKNHIEVDTQKEKENESVKNYLQNKLKINISKKDIETILSACEWNIEKVMQIIDYATEQKEIRNIVAWIISIYKKGIDIDLELKKYKNNKSKNKFINYTQNNYTEEYLKEMLQKEQERIDEYLEERAYERKASEESNNLNLDEKKIILESSNSSILI